MIAYILKNWILLTILVVGAAAAFIFWPKGRQEETLGTPSKTVTMTVEELDRHIAARVLAAEKEKGATVTDLDPVEKTTVPEPATDTVQTERVRDINNYREQVGGAVVRFIGRPVQKGGRTFLPLFKDPNHKGALTEPVDKSVPMIEENLSFIGVKPPVGKLAVYDVVRNPQSGALYNILAWEVQ